jgi:hypothetical protein
MTGASADDGAENEPPVHVGAGAGDAAGAEGAEKLRPLQAGAAAEVPAGAANVRPLHAGAGADVGAGAADQERGRIGARSGTASARRGDHPPRRNLSSVRPPDPADSTALAANVGGRAASHGLRASGVPRRGRIAGAGASCGDACRVPWPLAVPRSGGAPRMLEGPPFTRTLVPRIATARRLATTCVPPKIRGICARGT